MSDLPFGDTTSPEYVFNLLLVGNKEIFDSQFIFWNVSQFSKLIEAPVSISIGNLWPAMVTNTVIGGVILEVSNQYMENKSSSELSTRVVFENTLEECLIGIDNLAFFCKLLTCVPYFCKKSILSQWMGHDFRLCGLSHWKHFALWFLDEVFCSIFETVSFGCLNSFWIAVVCFIADSRCSEMSMAFCKDKFAPSLHNLCCVRSWFIPHTKRSLNIES